MSGFADYERYDALGLAELVQRKDVSPGELLDAAIERVEARNAAVNAVVMSLYDYGRKAIEDGLPNGPFRGVPFLLKDLGGWLAGVKVTRGSRFFADAPPVAADSEHVRRLKRAAECNLLAVWAQNGSDGVSRKHQLGSLRRALTKYRKFLADRPSIVAGDFNNNVYWHRPGWRINHANAVATLERLGLVSAYHALRNEQQGQETVPTLYWRDRKKDGPTYHIDYVFLPAQWLGSVRELVIGTFEDWCGSGLSDHVPIVVDINLQARRAREPSLALELTPCQSILRKVSGVPSTIARQVLHHDGPEFPADG